MSNKIKEVKLKRKIIKKGVYFPYYFVALVYNVQHHNFHGAKNVDEPCSRH